MPSERSNDLDVLALKFFHSLDSFPSNDLLKIFLVINPSFCGACDEGIMNFIETLDFGTIPIKAIMSSSDSKISNKLEQIPNCVIYYSDFNTMAKHGLYGAYNKIFVCKEGKIIFYSNFTPPNFKVIESQIQFLKQGNENLTPSD